MATIRMPRNRYHLDLVGLWLAGVLCGVALMITIGAFHDSQSSSQSTRQVAPVAQLSASSGVTGKFEEFLSGEPATYARSAPTTRLNRLQEYLPGESATYNWSLPGNIQEFAPGETRTYDQQAAGQQGANALPFTVASKLQP